jgi:hypothetical protein
VIDAEEQKAIDAANAAQQEAERLGILAKGRRAFSLIAIGEREPLDEEHEPLDDDRFAQEAAEQKVEPFSLAAYINDAAENQVDFHLPSISTDTSLDDIVGATINPKSMGVIFQDAEDETQDEKALKLQPAREALRRSQSRQRLLLEYVHKVELAAMNKGVDARMLFKSIDSDSDGFLNKHDLRKGLRALQIHIDGRCVVPVAAYVARMHVPVCKYGRVT